MSDIFKSFTDPIGSLLSKGIGSILDPAGITGLGGKSSGGLDLSAKVAPAKDATPATLIDPTTLPSLTSSDSQLAKRKAAATQLARKGRASTILTNPDSLGPGPG